ncbi:Homeodomain-like superfamily protein [Euphorbia peplus]|nr:Homeodomain-like superfamily protein [Euphorbia peplus]
MEDSSEMHDEENRVSVEKSVKRILKTPAQIMALEKFYTEQNYPSEEMKSELAEEIGLTEKQISSWFCHRRLKDKKVPKDELGANGRQDRSSGIMQDRGSGLRQDSCGSNKQSDYRKVDPKEVESRRLYGHNSSGADLTYDRTSQFTGNVNDRDDTSSESSSSLQDKLFNQNEDPYDMKASGHVMSNGAVRPSIPKSANKMVYKPSGYLKVKGEIENAAITAVKRQLGKHYREDGPPLGVEFQTLPPGAFSSLSKDPLSGAFYVGDLARVHSPDVSGGRKRPSMGNRYEVYNSKIGSEDSSYMEEANGIVRNASEARDKKPHHHLKRKPSYNNSNSIPGANSSMDYYDDLVAETSTPSSKRNYKMNSKHGIEGIRPDASNHHLPDDIKITNEQTEPWLLDHDNGSPRIGLRNDYLSKSSNLIPGPGKSLDLEARALCTSWEEEARLYGDIKDIKGYQDPVRVRKHLKNEMKVPKRFKDEVAQQEYVTKAPVPKWHQTTNFYKGSVMERPSSFSEDETAETSSSME